MNDKKHDCITGRRGRYLFGENRYHYPRMLTGEIPDMFYPFGGPGGAIGEDMLSGDTDPNGSYTGVPLNKDEIPVQDVDDL